MSLIDRSEHQTIILDRLEHKTIILGNKYDLRTLDGHERNTRTYHNRTKHIYNITIHKNMVILCRKSCFVLRVRIDTLHFILEIVESLHSLNLPILMKYPDLARVRNLGQEPGKILGNYFPKKKKKNSLFTFEFWNSNVPQLLQDN